MKLREPAPRVCLPGPGQAPHIYLDALGSTSRLSGHVPRHVPRAGLAASATAQVWRCIACPDPLRPSSLGPSRQPSATAGKSPGRPSICSGGLCLLCSTFAGREGLGGSLHVQGKVEEGSRGEGGGGWWRPRGHFLSLRHLLLNTSPWKNVTFASGEMWGLHL